MERDHQHFLEKRDRKERKEQRKKIQEQVLEETADGKETTVTGKKRKRKDKQKTAEILQNRTHSKDIDKEPEYQRVSSEEEHAEQRFASPGKATSNSVSDKITELKHGMEGNFQHYSRGEDRKDKSKSANKIQKQLLENLHNHKYVIGTKKKKKEKKEKSRGFLENGSLLNNFDDEAGEKQILMNEERDLKNRSKKKKDKERKVEAVEGSQAVQNEQGSIIHEAGVIESDGLGNDYTTRKLTKKNTKQEKEKKMESEKDTFDERTTDSGITDQVVYDFDKPDLTESESYKDDVEEIWGVRFTPEEDEILKEAIWAYIKEKGWDRQAGLDKIFNSRRHRDARNCWAEIKMSLPHRPRQAVRFRARLLLEEGNHLGKWSKEEEDLLKQLQRQHGNKWREISGVLNRQRGCIKEKWRTLKRSETVKKRGRWAQDELQQLAQAVHTSLRMSRSEADTEKKDHRILRDNIGWENIANTLGHHNHGPCCTQWYRFFESSLVAEGHWSKQDDFLLLKGLLESGASAEEEVEWDNLLDHRSGQVCLIRWKQMIKYIGEKRITQFLGKLDTLVRRYAPDLVEAP